MKFYNIYSNIDAKVRTTLFSLWGRGNLPFQKKLSELFDREPLLAEPVFQSMFGWEQVKPEDNSWKALFSDNFFNRIGKTQYIPYTHQVKSWKILADNTVSQSLVVTSGTGSGKTNCFMYPILDDLCRHPSQGVVNALFLYPLNALMQDQRDTLGRLCDQLGLRFGVYNGSTPEDHATGNPQYTSEVRTRREMRRDTPQILLSNPSMLEYILVRGEDQEFIQRSAGQLRWIVIDEAHTYSGSAALELACQLRRILQAFKMDFSDVHFVCTSASMGENEMALKESIAMLTGQSLDRINVVGGNRLVPEMSVAKVKELLDERSCRLDPKRVLYLRNLVNSNNGLDVRQIWNALHGSMQDYSVKKTLQLLDLLCSISYQDGNNREQVLLSLRGHYFLRSINGLYSTLGCSAHQRIFTSVSKAFDSKNGAFFELVQCRNCGKIMFLASLELDTATGQEYLLPHHDKLNDSDGSIQSSNAQRILFCTNDQSYKGLQESYQYQTFDIEETDDGKYSKVDRNGLQGKFVVCRDMDLRDLCPCCKKRLQTLNYEDYTYLQYFRIPVSLLNKLVPTVLLTETRQDYPWGNYIAFTDSRQGTAISSKVFNIDVERNYSAVKCLNFLSQKRISYRNTEEFQRAVKTYNVIRGQDPELEASYLAKINNDIFPVELNDLRQELCSENLFCHISGYVPGDPSYNLHRHAYQAALLRNFIGRKPMHEQTLETMGYVKLVYPQLLKIHVPSFLSTYCESRHLSAVPVDSDWQDFLKICIDFYIRSSNHLQALENQERSYIRDTNISTPIFPATYNPNIRDLSRWLTVDVQAKEPNRLVLLLCAGLGISSFDEFVSEEHDRHIFSLLLDQAWNDLTEGNNAVLQRVQQNGTGYNQITYNPQTYNINKDGFYLDLSGQNQNVKIQLCQQAKLCPVTGLCTDVTFMGYSPYISGYISKDDFEKYRVSNSIDLPLIDHLPIESYNDLSPEEKSKITDIQKLGLWSNKHELLFSLQSPYIAAEHSAQQAPEVLQRYVDGFKNGSINVLNCSTTMEMGVDLGDVEAVLMTTVPPRSSNYIQRVGRAGRRGQSQAIALSLCNATPVGQNAFNNPKWAIEADEEMSRVRPSDIIIQRHINSFFYRQFLLNDTSLCDMFRLKDFFDEGVCDMFIGWLEKKRADNVLEKVFKTVFPNSNYLSIGATILKIKSLKKEYTDLMSSLNDELSKISVADNPEAYYGIKAQINRIKMENLLHYLSENQFNPNANMPTGVVEFMHIDPHTQEKMLSLSDEIDTIRQNYLASGKTDTALKTELRRRYAEYESLKNKCTVARDVKTALNEYAPGQTVVINENNYVSAGVSWHGDFKTEARHRFIYHCYNCGLTEYSGEANKTECPRCHSPYRSILPVFKDYSHFAVAIEPVNYRTDSSSYATKYERTSKEYYDIRTALLDISWDNPETGTYLCQSVSSEEGRILYYNSGKGFGFAVCPKCGRAVLDQVSKTAPLSMKDHKMLSNGRTCPVGMADLRRNVVFTGEMQTTCTALKFYVDAQQSAFVKDKGLVVSLGVIIKRALVEHLGINPTEVEFGVKESENACVLFFFDTNKSGCGYSLVLNDPITLNMILKRSLSLLQSSGCKCEDSVSGACTKCLVERDSYHYMEILSKRKVLDWLFLQQRADILHEVPSEIKAESPDAIISYKPLFCILREAVTDPTISKISLGVWPASGDMQIADFINVKSHIGNSLLTAILNGKSVELLIEYNENDYDSVIDKLPFCDLEAKFPNFSVRAVDSLGKFPTALMLSDGMTHIRYFCPDAAILPMSSEWGNGMNFIYRDNQSYPFDTVRFPKLDDLLLHLDANKDYLKEGLVTVVKYPSSSYALSTIVEELILDSFGLDDREYETLTTFLRDDYVDVSVSDTYLNSPLSVIMLTSILLQLKQICGFKISSLEVLLPREYDRKKNFSASTYQSSQFLSSNFQSFDEANDALKKLLDAKVFDGTKLNQKGTNHARWIKFQTSRQASLEIRFDYGISGPWRTNLLKSQIGSDITSSFDDLEQRLEVYPKSDDIQILYYILVKD